MHGLLAKGHQRSSTYLFFSTWMVAHHFEIFESFLILSEVHFTSNQDKGRVRTVVCHLGEPLLFFFPLRLGRRRMFTWGTPCPVHLADDRGGQWRNRS